MTDPYERGRSGDVVEDIIGEAVVSPRAPTSGSGLTSGSTVEAVKEQSAQVGQQAADTGQHVASLAKEEAQAVASEASDRARDLLGETKTQLLDQLSTQQSALASVLRSLADELHDMAEQSAYARSSSAAGARTGGQSSTDGVAGQAVREVSARASEVAMWLEQREPGDVADEVTRFARRRPGLFLALAGGAGLVVGRFTRGLAGVSQDQSRSPAPLSTRAGAQPANPSAGSRSPGALAPAVALDQYPESTRTGASTRDAGSTGGSTHD